MVESEKTRADEGAEASPQQSEEKMNFILRGLSGMVGWAGANPYKMFALIAAITLILGYGLTMVNTTAVETDIFPKDNPNTLAAKNISQKFQQFYTTVSSYLVIDPEKFGQMNPANLPNRMTNADPNNATDELYIRGVHEFYQYMKMKVPATQYEIGPAAALIIVNWSNSGIPNVQAPTDSAFNMPGTDPLGEIYYYEDQQLLLSDPQIQQCFSKDYSCTSITFIFDPKAHGLTSAELGKQIIKAIDDWPAWAEENAKFAAFKYERTTANQVPITDGHAAELSERDNNILTPLVILFILACLAVSFRKLSYTLIGITALIIAVIWTIGLMGYVGIPFTNLNQTIVPLLLGCGIDYSLHMMTQYMQHRANGLPKAQAMRAATGRGGFAMFLSATTAVIGMGSLIFSPSVAMEQLGVVAPMGMVIALIVNMTFTPAAMALFVRDPKGQKQPEFRPAKGITKFADIVGSHRVIAIIIVLLLTAGAYVSSMNLRYEEFGDPQMNFLPGDKVRHWREMENENFYGGTTSDTTKTANFFIFEGDMTDPKVHTYMRKFAENLQSMPDQGIGQIMCLPWLIDSYLMIRQGTAGAAVSTIGGYIPGLGGMPGAGGTISPQYPQTQAAIKQTFDEMKKSPFWTQTAFFLDNDYKIGILPVDLLQKPHFEGVQHGWDAVWKAVEKTDSELGRPAGTKIAFYGLTSASYMFITYEAPWVNYVSIISSVAVAIILLLFTRNLKSTLLTVIVMTLTSVWWFGILPLFNIGISVILMLPVTFIMAMGSNYAILFIWNLSQVKDRESIYYSIGKSVEYSAITTIGAFFIFGFMSDLMSRKAMMSVWLATVVSWICAMIVVAIFYPPYPKPKAEKSKLPRQSKKQLRKAAMDSRRAQAAAAAASANPVVNANETPSNHVKVAVLKHPQTGREKSAK
ncbi:MAG: MMPL family transporter [Candidatus Thermoplasmatota archaeon]|nr:MMPL family transporter [Candidatus Thermoplasmatota archaeon]